MSTAIVMTPERRKQVEQLYKNGITITDIAKTLGISRSAIYSWIRSQDWYTYKNNSKADIIKRDLQCRTMDPFAANEQKQKGYFVIPWRLPGMNEFISAISSSRYRGADLKKSYENDIVICAKAGLDYDRPYPCAVHLRIHFVESNERRDYDNIQSGQKFILDALQTAGVIANDDQKHVLPSEYFFSVDPKYPRVEVEIIPHPDMPASINKQHHMPRKKAKESWRDMYGEEEIRTAYKMAANKNAQFCIFLDFGIPKKELERILGK